MLVLVALTRGYFDEIKVFDVQWAEERMFEIFRLQFGDILNEIRDKKDIGPELDERLNAALTEIFAKLKQEANEKADAAGAKES